MALRWSRLLSAIPAIALLMTAAAPRAMAEDAEASGPPPSPLGLQLAAYLQSVQDPSTGLPRSFLQSADPNLDRVAFTYDVAVAALALAHAGRFADAKRALSTYQQMPLPSRDTFDFNSAYRTDTRSTTLESRVHGGPIFWVAIALMRVGRASGDRAAVKKGVALLEWARARLRHVDGGVVMSDKDDQWGYLMSVENNWVYYAALRIATAILPEGRQRIALRQEQVGVRRWLTAHARERGLGDPVPALDVYTHALLVGPDAYLEDGVVPDEATLARWARAHIAELEGLFQAPGTALYDYTDAKEAQAAGRPRGGWLEGTEQVSLAYGEWAGWFERRGDRAFAKELRMKSAISHAAVLRFAALRGSGGIAIPNTSAAVPLRTFSDGWFARPRSEPALNGTNWAYLREAGYNPFTMELPRRNR